MTAPHNAHLPIQWDLLIKKRTSATQGVPPGKESLTWVANTVTLLYGQQDAVLVDTFLGEKQTDELADWVESHRRRLTTIYVTHAHPDHFFGLNRLLERFPNAHAVATPQVVKAMQRTIAPEEVENNWSKRWPGQVPAKLITAEPLDGEHFEMEGHTVHVIDTGHTDTDGTTALHVPSIRLVIAGDAIYNNAHPFLVETDRMGRQSWLLAIDKIEALAPEHVIVGHGPLNPDNSPRHINETRKYILDFDRIDQETSTARDLYDRMMEIYPDRINPGSLWGSANAAKSTTA